MGREDLQKFINTCWQSYSWKMRIVIKRHFLNINSIFLGPILPIQRIFHIFSNTSQIILVHHKGCFACIFSKYLIYYFMKSLMFEFFYFCSYEPLLSQSNTWKNKFSGKCWCLSQRSCNSPSFPQRTVSSLCAQCITEMVAIL